MEETSFQLPLPVIFFTPAEVKQIIYKDIDAKKIAKLRLRHWRNPETIKKKGLL